MRSEQVLPTLLVLISSIVAMTAIASGLYIIYPYNKYNRRNPGKVIPFRSLPMWEKVYLYFAAIYPATSLAAHIPLSNRFNFVFNQADTYTLPYLIFGWGHVLISAYSVAVCYYLAKQHRANYLLLALSLLAGAGYFIMVSWVYVIH